jgi:hypothetical protein
VYFGSNDGKFYALKGSGTAVIHPWPMFQHDPMRSGNVKDIFSSPAPDAIRPVLHSTRHRSESGLDFTLSGVVGQSYSIWVSSDLVSWTLFTNITSINGTIKITDVTATNRLFQFYRVTTP